MNSRARLISRVQDKNDIIGTSSSVLQKQLEEILASPFFRTSRRCSEMLRYIIEQFILDPSVSLKERTIGLAVFSRDTDYDTSNDSVVRSAAGEIRKRLAQYYMDEAEAAAVITLPPGSYHPVIRVGRQSEASRAASKPNPLRSVVLLLTAPKDSGFRWASIVTLFIALGLTAAIGIFWHLRAGPAERFWGPMRSSGLPPIICLGDTTRVLLDRGGADVVEEESRYGVDRNNHLALGDVLALNSFVSFLVPLTGKPTVRNASTTSFADLQRQPAILIGNKTDQWTMRAMKFLRFEFRQGNSADSIEMFDRRNPSNPVWHLDLKAPSSRITKTYAILARFTDPVTNQLTVIDAGAGPDGTIAGAQCLTTAICLQEIADRAPHGWEKRNVEIVMETDITKDGPGPARILQVYVW